MAKTTVFEMARTLDDDLRAIRQILRRPFDADIDRGNLTAPQQDAMRMLVEHGPQSLKELSRRLGLAHSTVSGIVDRLEARGLVKREPVKDDLRLTRILVTEEVARYLRETLPALRVHPLEQALRGATAADRGKILDGVKALRRVLEGTAAETAIQ